MDECFILHVHHGGHFTWDPQAYMGGTVDIMENCDLDKWSKVEIESIYGDFGYTAMDKLWFKMPGVNPEQAHSMSELHEVDAEQVGARRASKAPVVNDQVEESSEAEGSDLKEEPQMQPMDIGKDSTESWDWENQAEDDEVKPGQMGGGVMNSDYKSEELLSLDESSSSNEHCNDSSDGETPTAEVDNSIRRSRYPIFRPVAKAENLRFEKDMLFLSPKQFKDAMTDYAVQGGWGIKFVKNDLVRVRARCQPGCKFVAYLTKVPRENSFRLKTLNMEHTCNGSYRNPKCTTLYIGKKLMKRVRRQPDIRLKDIQDAVHEKYVFDISASKVSRAREKAQEAVAKDGHVNSPTVGSAQPDSNAHPTVHKAQLSSTDDVTTTAPPPPLITSPIQDQKDRGREVQSPLRP
nr:hypothetical protein CFP56_38527 [Quercus suber]